jgi:hypothetical protein
VWYSHVTLMNHYNQLYIPYLWQYCLRMHCHPSLFIVYLLMCFLSFFLSFISVHGFLFVRCLLDESMDIKFLFIRCIYLYFYSYPIVSFRLGTSSVHRKLSRGLSCEVNLDFFHVHFTHANLVYQVAYFTC